MIESKVRFERVLRVRPRPIPGAVTRPFRAGDITMHTGSCHCGHIAFEVEGDFDEAMEANCSRCSGKGYLL